METQGQTLNDKSPHDDVGREETVETAQDEADNEVLKSLPSLYRLHTFMHALMQLHNCQYVIMCISYV